MRKYCEKCGNQLPEDDFLCPGCGAIWGDRIYRVPTAFEPVHTDTEEAQENEEVSVELPPKEQAEPAAKNQPRWVVPLSALCLVLAFGMFLMGTERKLWAVEGSSTPTTTSVQPEPTSTEPPASVSGYITYTVTFVDPYGTPIPGVFIENFMCVISSSLKPSVSTSSGSDGTVSFVYPSSLASDAHVKISYIPAGYDQSMVGQTKYFVQGQTEMLIVLDFSDEPVAGIIPILPGIVIDPVVPD